MPVELYRIDDRLIHGQVVVGWGQPLDIGFIVLVDDEVAASEWEQELYRMGVPPEMDVYFHGVDDAVPELPRYVADRRRGILLTGDIERQAEAALVAARDDLRSDVVKVAHHGSRTSSTESFVAAVRPSVAVVSVGLASPFGHPDKNVVERWRANGAQVLQTGQSGTITISTDGRDLKVETFVRE